MNDEADHTRHSSVVPIEVARRSRAQDATPSQFADAYEFLRAVYNASELPLHVPLEAARIAIKYEKPPLKAAGLDDENEGLADRVECPANWS
jgi:hypothetical protein